MDDTLDPLHIAVEGSVKLKLLKVESSRYLQKRQSPRDGKACKFFLQDLDESVNGWLREDEFCRKY